MYNSTMQCIDHWNHSGNNSEVCEQCMQNYIELNNFYNNMTTDSVGLEGVCVDVVDSVSILNNSCFRDHCYVYHNLKYLK